MTVTGQLLGSPAYMSPEHVSGGRLDFRTDVFSVGILLYQLVVGDLPFAGKNPHEILKRIAGQDAAALPDLYLGEFALHKPAGGYADSSGVQMVSAQRVRQGERDLGAGTVIGRSYQPRSSSFRLADHISPVPSATRPGTLAHQAELAPPRAETEPQPRQAATGNSPGAQPARKVFGGDRDGLGIGAGGERGLGHFVHGGFPARCPAAHAAGRGRQYTIAPA
jgi:serine/threonine protein kinase